MASANTKVTAPASTARLSRVWDLVRFIAGRLLPSGNLPGRQHPPDSVNESGRSGEKIAARFLRGQGYKILVRNYSSRWGEIDIVCRHQNTLVFVEVKTRGKNSWGTPAAAVTRSKQRRLILTAHAYLKELEEKDIPCRFDVVEVYLDSSHEFRCELIPSAFQLPERA